MTEIKSPKLYDLEDRTYNFAAKCREYLRIDSKPKSYSDDARQLIRSSGSVAANYIEANESLSKKDFIMRIKICRKEAKESVLWLRLLKAPEELIGESRELTKIFGAILEKSK